MSEYRKKMIEVAMPLEAINKESAREKSIRHGHPSTLHLWWARRPLASCRAVLFGQLVDDPSSWPERFPTEEEQDAERKRLFGILEELVLWENSNNTRVLNIARKEIAQSLARSRIDTDEGTERDADVAAGDVTSDFIDSYLAEVAPPVHDPFAGGGSIPLEAQRLGLRAIATDLNPVAVLINKALIEIPPKFAGRAPVHPKAEKRTSWSRAEGLAEDVHRYGEWMLDEAKQRIGHLYPEVDLPEEHGGGKATVIAWLWAPTVESPDPAFKGVHVPLVSNFFLGMKKGKEAWVEPVVEGRDYRFEIRTGKPENAADIKKGTKLGRGASFRCVMSGAPLEPDYIKAEGKAKRMAARLMAIVAEGNGKRIYLPSNDQHRASAASAEPTWRPTGELPGNRQYSNPPLYGMEEWGDLFTSRQLVALTTFSDLVQEVRERAITDARATGWNGDELGLEEGGNGSVAYADAIAVYLSFAISRMTDLHNRFCTWSPLPSKEHVAHLFGRQAFPIVWDYAECNPFTAAGGGWVKTTRFIPKVIEQAAIGPEARAWQSPSASSHTVGEVIATDPPYYDNVPYADLSDFFYVWLRRGLRRVLPSLFGTLLVPKTEELVANPHRHGGKSGAKTFFERGMDSWLSTVAKCGNKSAPATVFYAFRQSETTESGTSSTGWETFLSGLVRAGMRITGTWPLRTERNTGLKGSGNFLASSVVLCVRPWAQESGSTITRADFRRLLVDELPAAIHDLQKSNLAPVDMSQASIGPGMAVFSRHSKVIEADGSAMSVRKALQIINEVVGEICDGEEMDLDGETRFAITWFETHGFVAGSFGESETLATSRNVSVAAVAQAGLLHSAAGKTRLLTREELPEDWDPRTDSSLTVWECTQHLIKRLEQNGEQAAAELLNGMGPRAEAARSLAYRLYTHCERNGNAEEARAYNGLVVAWPELEKLASQATSSAQPAAEQAGLFEDNS